MGEIHDKKITDMSEIVNIDVKVIKSKPKSLQQLVIENNLLNDIIDEFNHKEQIAVSQTTNEDTFSALLNILLERCLELRVEMTLTPFKPKDDKN